MSSSDHPDPWASLAESLGVGSSGSEPQQPREPARPAPPPPRTAERQKPKAPPAAAANWDALATDLGLSESGDAPRPAAPPQRPVAEPQHRAVEAHREEPRVRDRARHDDERHEERRRTPPPETPRTTRDHERDDARGERAADDTGSRPVRDEAREGDRDDRGGRRRRGRRGGRSRRDRETAGAETRDAGAPATRRDDDFRGDAVERPWPDDDAPAVDPDTGDVRGAAPSGPVSDDDEDRPRRRRRRGRRGGRGRSRGDRDTDDVRTTDRDDIKDSGRDSGSADEPLPTSYGMRGPARPAESRDEPTPQGGRRRANGDRSRSADGDEAGAARGRRRRRRRSGEGRPSTAGRSADEPGRGRRSRRGSDERGGSSRVRRADFAPVSGGYDEDDEGLEFLGVEEAGRDSGRREPRGDDDVLAESGLADVRDVPSWVEAIGIVIAGNLDARTRGRGEGRQRDR